MTRKITTSEKTNVWFSSDWHLFHANIIKYSNRPFSSVKEMNSTIIDNWNSNVKEEDICFFLGDFAFLKTKEDEKQLKDMILSLKGKEIHFIRGNHDKSLKGEVKQLFDSYGDYCEIEVNDIPIIMSHYPFLSWNKSFYGSYMLHGHCHGTLKDDPHSKRIDIGVDCWNYFPVSFDMIKAKMDMKLEFIPAETVQER